MCLAAEGAITFVKLELSQHAASDCQKQQAPAWAVQGRCPELPGSSTWQADWLPPEALGRPSMQACRALDGTGGVRATPLSRSRGRVQQLVRLQVAPLAQDLPGHLNAQALDAGEGRHRLQQHDLCAARHVELHRPLRAAAAGQAQDALQLACSAAGVAELPALQPIWTSATLSSSPRLLLEGPQPSCSCAGRRLKQRCSGEEILIVHMAGRRTFHVPGSRQHDRARMLAAPWHMGTTQAAHLWHCCSWAAAQAGLLRSRACRWCPPRWRSAWPPARAAAAPAG